MAHKVVWTNPALAELDQIAEYISKSSESHAASVVKKIFSAANQLGTFPRMGRQVPEEETDDFREILVFNWRVIYFVSEFEVRILSVTHGAQRWRG